MKKNDIILLSYLHVSSLKDTLYIGRFFMFLKKTATSVLV